MMHNTHFIKQTENYARVIQYMTLLNTTENEKSNIVSPIIYDFEFYKINDIWKISKRKINLDYKLDLPFKKWEKLFLIFLQFSSRYWDP